jgi:undecaprenyl-diphosphatase
MPYRRFLAFNAAGAAIWSVVVVLLGYYVGESWRAAEAWIGNITTVLLALVGLGLAFHLRGFIRSVVPLDLALMVISVGIFGAIAEDVLTQDPLVRLDASLASWLSNHHTETVTTVLTAVTTLHDPLPVTVLMVGVGGLLLWKRRYRWLATFVAATAGGTLLNLALKQVFHRTRPLVEHGVLVFSGFSFPSGHVAAATLLYGFVAAFGVTHIRNTRLRIAVLASAAAMMLAVAFSRLYLGAHFLSDTLAAFAAAVAWLTLCIVIFHGRLS